ncbi:MAG: ferredoxin [Dongiaceae bacterium]
MEEPFYSRHIFCCTNKREASAPKPSCGAHGSEELRRYFKERVKQLSQDPNLPLTIRENLQHSRVNIAGCLDRCELGPVMVVYPEGVWYHYKNREDIEEIIQKHLLDGGIVSRLLLKNDSKSVA